MEKVAVFLWKGVFEVERWKGEMVERFPRNKLYQAIYCVITSGVAKSVCHRDRRSLPKRQLRCLCRTDFGSPQIICVNRLTRDPVFLKQPPNP